MIWFISFKTSMMFNNELLHSGSFPPLELHMGTQTFYYVWFGESSKSKLDFAEEEL